MELKNNGAPDLKDCRMTIHTREASCYIMDTFCRDITPEKRKEIEGKIMHIYRQAVLKNKTSKTQEKS